MPTYLDIHDLPGATLEDIAHAHHLDLETQAKYGVEYLKYWVNQKNGKVFCVCHAPSADAADAVHRDAHGARAARITEVTPEMAEAFLGAEEVSSTGAVLLPGKTALDPGTRTILFTDIVGSTDHTQRLGDELAFALLEIHYRIVRTELEGTGGREVKHTGDGIMAVFHSAHSGVRCALNVQNNIVRHRQQNPEQSLQLRIGIASGEPIERHNDLFGSAVQLAARLCAHAEPDPVRAHCIVSQG